MNLPKWMLDAIKRTEPAPVNDLQAPAIALSKASKQAAGRSSVYLYRKPVDFRNSMVGLVRLLSTEAPATFYAGEAFVFTNSSRNAIKVLYRDDNGFCLLHKRLDEGSFAWPSTLETGLRKLADSEFEQLFGGAEFPFERFERIAA